MTVAALLALWPAALADGYTARALGGVGGAAVLVLAVALALRLSFPVPVALFVLGGEYAVSLAVRDAPLDARAPAYAAGLLASAELAYWSLELHGRVADEAGAYWRRLALLAGQALAAVAVGAGLLAVVDLAAAGGLIVDAVGVAAAVAAVGLVLVAARRRTSGPPAAEPPQAVARR